MEVIIMILVLATFILICLLLAIRLAKKVQPSVRVSNLKPMRSLYYENKKYW